MTYQHPMSPPRELVQEWINEGPPLDQPKHVAHFIAGKAAQWGADQELEACCEWLRQQTLCGHVDLIPSLRAARRPPPPSLAEEALGIIERGRDEWSPLPEDWDKLQAAAERLAELEQQINP